MSIEALNAVFSRTDLPPYERLVMLALADRADEEMTCWPSIADICQRTGMAERGVQNVLNRLENGGFLTIKRGGGRQVRNGYLLHISAENPASETPYPKAIPRTENPVSGAETPHPITNTPHPVPKTPHPVPTNHHEPSRTVIDKKDLLSADFDEFWSVVPKRAAKEKARAAYAKARRKADAATILTGIRAYAESRRGEDPQYTAHPASWLNAGRWTDEITKKSGGENGKPDRLSAMLRGAASSPLDRGAGCYPPQPLLARR